MSPTGKMNPTCGPTPTTCDWKQPTRSPEPLSHPSDLHYIAVGIVLVVSAGLGVLVASQIVVVLGYTG